MDRDGVLDHLNNTCKEYRKTTVAVAEISTNIKAKQVANDASLSHVEGHRTRLLVLLNIRLEQVRQSKESIKTLNVNRLKRLYEKKSDSPVAKHLRSRCDVSSVLLKKRDICAGIM